MSSPVGEGSSPLIPPSGQGNAFTAIPAADLESLSGSEYSPSDGSNEPTSQPPATLSKQEQQPSSKSATSILPQPASAQQTRHTSSHGWHSREPGERPNRFAGSARTWLRFTEEERRLAESLEVTRSRNLAIHLYNAFMLKKRLAGRAGAETQWQLPALWTAWPLEPDVVPRPGEVTSVTFAESWQEPLTSRQELEEVLIATVMAEAKKRVVARQAPFVKRARAGAVEKRGAKRRKLDAVGDEDELSNSPGADEDAVSASWRSKIKRSSSQPTSKHSESEDDEPKRTTLQNSPRLGKRSTSTRDAPLAVPSSNDEHATKILLPTVRNIQSNLDTLLKALHRTRLTHHNIHKSDQPASRTSRNILNRHPSRSRSKTQSSLSSSPSSSSSSHSQRSSTRSSSLPPTGDDSASASASDSDAAAQTDPARRQRDSRLGLRDWSEVLGLAAITGGFSTEVLERSRKRCAELFGEEMGMRVLEPQRRAGVGVYARGEVLDDVHLDGFPVMGRRVERGGLDGGVGGKREEEDEDVDLGIEGKGLKDDDGNDYVEMAATGREGASRGKKEKKKQKGKSKEKKGKGKEKEQGRSKEDEKVKMDE